VDFEMVITSMGNVVSSCLMWPRESPIRMSQTGIVGIQVQFAQSY
jgi:hypothetical protein